MNAKERELLKKASDALDVILAATMINESINAENRKITPAYMQGLSTLGEYITLVEDIYKYLKTTPADEISIADLDDYEISAKTAVEDGNRD